MKSKIQASVNFKVFLELNEDEARALDAIVGYGFDPFLKVFKQHMGEHYIKGYETGAETLFKSVRASLSTQLHDIDQAHKAISIIDNLQIVKPD